jgi:hypothetical protein
MIVHRVDTHLLPEIVHIRGIPATSGRRTALDLAGMRHPRTEGVVDAILRRGLDDIGAMWLYLEREWQRGRRGVRILGEALIPRTQGRAPTDSDLELELRGLMDAAGLAEPEHQFPIRIACAEVHADLSYPWIRLDIEVDSRSWHLNRVSFERDRERDNELQMLGWTVLRFTWAQIRYRSEWVIDTIRTTTERLRELRVADTAT